MDLFIPMLVLGLVTSVHCVAMCGPLVLTYAVKDGQEAATWKQRLAPHVAYQGAKITSYMAVGLVLGLIGSAFDLAGIRGWVMVAAAIFMLMLGLSMTGKFPWLHRFVPRPPKSIMHALMKVRRKANKDAEEGTSSLATPVMFGLLTGLMPCAPLQAAQLSAASAGSAAAGALSMFAFGLGTAPLMLAFGTVSGLLSAKFKNRMMAVLAVVVIVFGFVMLNRGLLLLGSPITGNTIKQAVVGAPANPSGASGATEVARGADGVAEVRLTIANVAYQPSTLSIPAGEPVRLIVDRQEDNLCSDEIVFPQLGVRQKLAPFGTTEVMIPATEAGTYTMTCQMGMMSGQLAVGAGAAASGAERPSLVPWLAAGSFLLAITFAVMLEREKRAQARLREEEEAAKQRHAKKKSHPETKGHPDTAKQHDKKSGTAKKSGSGTSQTAKPKAASKPKSNASKTRSSGTAKKKGSSGQGRAAAEGGTA